jgi:hypothetical protein
MNELMSRLTTLAARHRRWKSIMLGCRTVVGSARAPRVSLFKTLCSACRLQRKIRRHRDLPAFASQL